ncbi:DUF7224 domain-containing protein [Actinotignum sp. GS-2025f]|uniref:DUF7224 domain-containing protein n=1 Tax=unclassified Actinotignum TaxID=2632702 RepID=UPI002A832B43|nr:hypothetical protein [Actinotignum sp. SLA_B059]MDY5128265.1 hypothetical protein [Actinotignum sp. SLA_B059]
MIFWPYLKRHPHLISALLTLIVGTIALWLLRDSWVGYTSATANYALCGFIFGMPLVSAMQAIHSERIRAVDLPTWVPYSPRRVLMQNVSALMPGLITILFTGAVLSGAALGVTAMAREELAPVNIHPIIGYLCLGFLGVLIGHMIGRIDASSAVLAVGSFGVMLGIAMFTTQYTVLEPYMEVSLPQLYALIAVTALAFIPALFLPRRTGWHKKQSVGSLIFVFIAAATLIATSALFPEPSQRRGGGQVCTTSQPFLCVWKEHEPALRTFTNISDRILPLIPEGMPVADTFEEFALNGNHYSGRTLNFASADMDDESMLVTALVYPLTNRSYEGGSNSDAGNAARNDLDLWLMMRGAPNKTDSSFIADGHDSATVERARAITALPEAEQRAWAQATYAASVADLER